MFGSAAVVTVLLGSSVSVAGLDDAPVVKDRTIRDERITEASGLAPSLQHPGVLWTHEDSGHPAQLHAISTSGRTLATLRVRGAEARDWEAIASLPDPDKTSAPLLAVGDIGDNRAARKQVEVLIVREPARLDGRETVKPMRTLRLRYPGSPIDAEALLADPRTGRLFLVTKMLLGAEIYAIPEKAWPGSGPASTSAPDKVWTLERFGSAETSLVTDGSFLPDGRVLVRSYSGLTLLAPPARASKAVARMAVLGASRVPEQQQGEGLAVVDEGRTALLGSEGARQAILRVPVPRGAAVERAASGASPAAAARDAASSAQAEKPDGPGTGVLIALGVLGLLLVAGLLRIAIVLGSLRLFRR